MTIQEEPTPEPRPDRVPFAAELIVAKEAAARAAAILMRGRSADPVRAKARADLVTDVDEAAENAITDHIRSRFPADSIIAEEFSADAVLTSRGWIVDPLDGTVNFVHGHPFTCVSIAFVDDKGPAVGVVHAPFLGEVYHAVRGRGAFLNERRLQVSATENGADGLYATGFPFKAGKGDPETYFRLVADIVGSSHGVRRAGAAAIDLAYVAAGRVDAFFEIGLAPWDIAAGVLLVLEAGGRVTGWPGDTQLPIRSGRIVASNGKTHDWLVERISNFSPPL